MTWIGLAVGGALAVWAVVRLAVGYPRPRERYTVLLRPEVAFLEAASETTFPPGGAVPPSGVEARIPAYLDGTLARTPLHMRVLMRMLFFLVEHATLFFPAPGRLGWRRFTKLSPEQRLAVLEGWRTSRLFPRRLVFTSLRALLTMGYFGDPAVLRALRLAPLRFETPVVEADVLYPPLGESAPRYGRADLTPPSDGTPLDPAGPLHPDYAERA